MTVGSILVGVAVLAVVVAYLARPFRPAGMSADRTIEAWVKQVRAEDPGRQLSSGKPKHGRKDDATASAQPAEADGAGQAINYCPKCGRRVDPDDRFCSGCGTELWRRAR